MQLLFDHLAHQCSIQLCLFFFPNTLPFPYAIFTTPTARLRSSELGRTRRQAQRVSEGIFVPSLLLVTANPRFLLCGPLPVATAIYRVALRFRYYIYIWIYIHIYLYRNIYTYMRTQIVCVYIYTVTEKNVYASRTHDFLSAIPFSVRRQIDIGLFGKFVKIFWKRTLKR